MHRPLSLVALILLAAGCGSTAEPNPVPPPPPPPPPAGPPATVTIQTGDAQSSEPGRPVAVRPAVLVKDASGRPVAGAAVTFAVDSGGGTIAGAQTATDVAGVATAGDWSLGPAEGRNILRATVGALAPARFIATASFTGVMVSAGSVGSAGGRLVIDRPGSALNRLEIEVPASAFTQSVTFSVVTSSSAGLTLGGAPRAGAAVGKSLQAAGGPAAGLNPATPIITIHSNGPHTAAGEVLLRIPIPKGIGFDLVVAVVDSVGFPLAFLPVLAVDTASATVSTQGLDGALYAKTVPSTTSQNRKLSVVVFAVGTQLSVPELWPAAVTTNFRIGVNNWEFPDQRTARYGWSDAGMTLVEWLAMYRMPGGLYNHFQNALGVESSNTRGLRMSGELTNHYYFQHARNHGSARIAGYANPNPAQYTKALLMSVLYDLWYRGPTPLLLTNGVDDRLVLVFGWNPANQTLLIREPDLPGTYAVLTFSNGQMMPYASPSNLTKVYTIPYHATSSAAAMIPFIDADLVTLAVPNGPEPHGDVWPANRLGSWDPVIYGSNRTIPDSVIMVGDTTRIWPMEQHAKFPSGLAWPLPPGWDVEIAYIYDRNRTTGQWTLGFYTFTNSTYVNAKQKPWFEQTFGFEIRRVEAADYSKSSWLGWQQVDVVKYGLSVADVAGQPGTPVTFTITSPGGPALPSSATYDWQFNDGTPLTRLSGSGPVPVTHTFAAAGTYTVDLKIYHKRTAQLIAKARAIAQIGTVSKWRLTSFQQTGLSNTFPLSLQPAAPGWEKALTMNEIRDSILARVGGGLLELIPPGGTRPSGFKQSNDFSYRAEPSAVDTTIYLTFPRGTGVLAEAVAGVGLATAPTLTATFHPFKPFTNTYVKTVGTAVTYTGTAANWVAPVHKDYTCAGSPQGTSPARGYIEFSASTVSTGLTGTITFVTQTPLAEVQIVPTSCVWNPIGEIRRTFSFTAAPEPGS